MAFREVAALGTPFIPGDCHSLTPEEQQRLIDVVCSCKGTRLTRGDFHDAVLLLFEDIPGLERITSKQERLLLRSLWRLYHHGLTNDEGLSRLQRAIGSV